MRSFSSIDATVTRVFFVDSAFAHRGDEYWQLRFLDEIVDLVQDTMANGASIHENKGTLSPNKIFHDNIDNIVLGFWIIRGLGEIDGGLKSSPLNLGLDHISG
jgi:hypothetical protein